MKPARYQSSLTGLRRSNWVVPLIVLGLAVACGALVGDPPSTLSAPPEPAGMKALFTGKDLTGWDGDPRLWSVKEGAIRGETTPEAPAKGNTFLILKGERFRDFDLRLSFRCSASNNSGVQYRSRHITEGKTANNWVVRGYQCEIRNENMLPNVAGFIYDEGGKRGRICLVGEKAVWQNGKKEVQDSFLDAEGYRQLFRLNDWNDLAIIAVGNRVRHFLNGTLVTDFTDADPESALTEGIIALQLHAGKPMWTEFKNIRVKEIREE
jgi:hypothetical protein